MTVTKSPVEKAPTRDELVERARSLFPLLRENARRADEERHIPSEVIKAFLDTGLIRTQIPERWGGYEAGFTTALDIGIELGRASGSAGWVLTLLIDHGYNLALFGEQAQEDVWADGPDVCICTSLVPTGSTVEPEDGGYRLTGQWSWSSGAAHSTWEMLGGVIPGDEPQFRLFLIPTAELEIHDTWWNSALRGTGSDSVEAVDVFVPEHRTLRMDLVQEGESPGSKVHSNPLYAVARVGAWSAPLLGPAIGMARGMLDSWVEFAGKKVSAWTQEQVADIVPAQITMASAAARVDAAELLVRRALGLADAGSGLTMEQRVRNRRDCSFAMRQLVLAANELIQVGGAAGLLDDSPLQRGWRDIQAVACHITMHFEAAAQNYARMRMGLPLNPRDPFR